MNYSTDQKPPIFTTNDRPEQRRVSINDDYAFDPNDTVAMDHADSIDDRRGNYSNIFDDAEMRHDGDAGFAAIELLRHQSPSMDDQGHSNDALSIDDGGGEDLGEPSSSSNRINNGVDLSFTPLEDVMYELQREIRSVVSHSEQSNPFPEDGSQKFYWTEHARSLLENAIVKLRLRHQPENNGYYSLADDADSLELMNRILLPLWPEGWMSSDELNQIIRRMVMNAMEEEFVDADENADIEHYSNDHSNDATRTTKGSCDSEPSAAAIAIARTITRPSYQDNSGGSSAGNAMCFICDRSFQSAHLLKIHISHMHTPKALVCPQCQSRHSTLNGLRFHFSTKHKGLSQRFISELTPPTPTVTVMSSTSSTMVGNSYQQQQQRQQSRMGATATAYISTNELRSLPGFENSSPVVARVNARLRYQLPPISAASSDRHQNGSSSNSTPANESGEVECSSCKNKFATVGSLKAHISMMHTEKNVRCRYCPNMYATQRAMLQHTYLKHHKERNCQCPQCGESFNTPSLMSLHRRYAHAFNSSTDANSTEPEPNFDDVSERNSSDDVPADQPNVDGSSLSMQPMARLRGNGKYHCRDCGAGFPMPSAVWAHRKKEHSDSTSIKKRGGFFATADPKRSVGGQIFGFDVNRQGKDANGKKKMRVKCSVCNAIFSNGYACYLHKKKIHGEDSIRRELNLSERSSSAAATTSTAPAIGQPFPKPPQSMPAQVERTTPVQHQQISNSGQETAAIQQAISAGLGQARISTSSSSSRDSSPFYRPSETVLPEGIMRRRYEFHCQCGMTFFNGFAFSRHRQRTGCGDGVRGIVVKESICGVCAEIFSTPELLNEHFNNVHGSTSGSSPMTTLASVMPKFTSPHSAILAASTADHMDDELMNQGEPNNYQKDGETTPSSSLTSIEKSPTSMHPKSSAQRMEPTAKPSKDIEPSTSEAHPNPDRNGSTTKMGLDNILLLCQLCPYETISMEALEEHRHRHVHVKSANVGRSTSSSISCPYCNYTTDVFSNFVRHASLHFIHKSVHGSPPNARRQDANATSSSGKEKNRLFQCTYCGRNFDATQELMDHELMHGDNR